MLIVKTTGPFALSDFTQGGVLIGSRRPVVVSQTAFISTRISIGQLKLIAKAPDEANNDDFQAFLDEVEGDEDLAIASYLSSLEDNDETDVEEKKAPPRKGRGRKAAE